MPVGIKFIKAKAERFLDCLANGKPPTPSGVGWTADDMLALAGACHSRVMSDGPPKLSDREARAIHPVGRGVGEETFPNDLVLAIQFYSQLTMLVGDGKYDESFDPEVRAVVFEGEDGPSVKPISGFQLRDGA